MNLTEGVKNNIYFVRRMSLPLKTAKRLEALGMTAGTEIAVLNKKNSAVIVAVRGTRFALGKAIAQNIEIDLKLKIKNNKSEAEAQSNDDRFYR